MTPPEWIPPKLRDDLLVSRQAWAGREIFVVKDPSTGGYFRFGEAERFLTEQLDGRTPAGVIEERLRDRFGAAARPGALEAFVDSLDRLGLLENGRARAPARARRIRGSLLYLRVHGFDPDRFLDLLLGRARFCFTPWFAAMSLILVLMGIGVAVAHWDEMVRELPGLLRFEAFVLAWGVLLLVTAVHEVAHGLACKHSGGEVHDMGFMLIYFQPALYCNVSESWLFPQKSKRLLVTFAGAWCELMVWAAATLVWRVTDPTTWIGFCALIVMATSGVKTFFNLNPLIKLDGYYLLSDFLEIPNLRSRAFAYLRGRAGRLWGARLRPPDATPRERRVLTVYGLLAGAYSIALLSLITVHLGGFLVSRYQGAGVVMSAALLTAFVGSPLRRPAPAPSEREPPRGRTAGRLPPRSLRRPALLVTMAGGVAALFFLTSELRVAGEVTLTPLHRADVRVEAEGAVVEVYVDEGERVRPGDPIARLSDADYRAKLGKVEADLDEARSRLRLILSGPRKEEIDLALAESAKVQERAAFAARDLERARALFAGSLISRQQLDEVEEEAAVRGKEVQQASAGLRLQRAGSHPDEARGAEARVAALEVERGRLLEQARLTRIVSPIAGVVSTPRPKEKVGHYARPGDLIVQVHDSSRMTAEIAVPEKDAGDVRVGQPILLKARAFPERSFHGTVTEIATMAAERSPGWRERVIRVTTVIDNPEGLLKPEMTGVARILCGRRRIIEVLTRRLVRYLRVEVLTWW